MAKIEFSFQQFTKRVPLTISRGTSTHTMMGWLRWTENGVAGWGEAVPFAIDEQPQTVEGYEAALAANRGWLEQATAWERIEIDRRLRAEGAPSGLIAAVNIALWDWLGKRLGQPVWRLLGLPATLGPLTSVTGGISEPHWAGGRGWLWGGPCSDSRWARDSSRLCCSRGSGAPGPAGTWTGKLSPGAWASPCTAACR